MIDEKVQQFAMCYMYLNITHSGGHACNCIIDAKNTFSKIRISSLTTNTHCNCYTN